MHDYVVVSDVTRASGWRHVLSDCIGVGWGYLTEVWNQINSEKRFDALRWGALLQIFYDCHLSV